MKLDLGQAIKFGWHTTTSNFPFILELLLIVFVLEFGPTAIATTFQGSAPVLAFLINLIGTVISIIVSVAILKIALTFVDGGKPTLSNLYQGYSSMTVLKYLGTTLLSAVVLLGAILPGLIITIIVAAVTSSAPPALVIGIPLMIAPALYFGFRLGQAGYAIVDKDASVWDALKFSYNITNGHVLQLLVLALTLLGITILGFLAIGLGLLLAVPTCLFAAAHVYRQLEKSSSQSQPANPSPAAPTV